MWSSAFRLGKIYKLSKANYQEMSITLSFAYKVIVVSTVQFIA